MPQHPFEPKSVPGHVPELSPELSPELAAGDPVAWTRALVRIPSVNPSLEATGTGEGAVADLVAQALEVWGFEVTCVKAADGPATPPLRRPSVVGWDRSAGAAAPTVLLCGHLDTVGVEGMQVSPYGDERQDDTLHVDETGRSTTPEVLKGRGSADMKSGVAAILHAAAQHRRRSAVGRPAVNLVVALTADEEHASRGLEALLSRGLLSGAGGGATVDFAIVCEPTSLALAPANKGFLWVTVRAHGRAAHGSRPEIGRDAIRQIGRFLAALDALDETPNGSFARAFPAHPLLGDGSLHAGTIRGGVAPSVYPEAAEVELEVRLLPGDTPERWLAALAELARTVEAAHPDVPLTLEPGLVRPGADLDVAHPGVAGLWAALEAEGIPPRIEPMTAWVESAWLMEAGIPALCFGPGSIAQAHTVDEWVSVHEIRSAARVLDGFLQAGGGLTGAGGAAGASRPSGASSPANTSDFEPSHPSDAP